MRSDGQHDEMLLEMKGICKRFPGVVALDHVDFFIRRGEVQVLMGENGAGKSTLIKILTGIYKQDEGTIRFDGQPLALSNALDAQKKGISTIYQEISLIPQLSVAENIFLGREFKNHGLIDWKKITREARRLLEDMGIRIDVKKPVNRYGTAIQQMIALARATYIRAKLVVMDEATSSMDEDEVRILFSIIRKLKEQGASVLFISHRLNEVFEIADRITVLKDGVLVGEYQAGVLSRLELITKMVGRDASDILSQTKPREARDFPAYLKASDIHRGVKLNGVNLTIGRGEVVGLAGLLGSGRTELARILFGADAMDCGDITIDGKKVRFRLPAQAIGFGLAFCSENRKVEGIFPNLSVRDNMLIASMRKVNRHGIVSPRRQQAVVQEYIDAVHIKTPSMEQSIANLSGGNQQKVLLARWMCMKPDFLILDEPTRGIDVGAKKEIEELIRDIASQGISVLLISSEFEELIRNCDRLVVVREGRNVGELRGEAITENGIMQAIAGGQEKEGGWRDEKAAH